MARSGVSLVDFCKENNYTLLLSYLVDKEDMYLPYASHAKVRWRCNEGHIFYNEVYKYTSRGRQTYLSFSCPICRGKRVEVGVNDLATICPDLSKEWDYERNDFTPQDVTYGSSKYAWWVCDLGHHWNARISARSYSSSGCPYCKTRLKSSIGELFTFFYARIIFGDEVISRAKLNGVEYDIYIPSKQTVIEYDGYYWHSLNDTTYKEDFAKSLGLNFFRIIEGVLTETYDNTLSFDVSKGLLNSCFSEVLISLFNRVCDSTDMIPSIDLKRDFAKIKLMSFNSIPKVDDDLLLKIQPFWDEEANGYPVSAISNDGLNKYWRCKYGHSFERRLDVIARFPRFVCPYCENKRSWRFYCFIYKSNYYVLDLENLDVECCSYNLLVDAVCQRVNIRGVLLVGSTLSISNNYLLSMSQTSFREAFKCCRDSTFNCVKDTEDCKEFTNILCMCFRDSPEMAKKLLVSILCR